MTMHYITQYLTTDCASRELYIGWSRTVQVDDYQDCTYNTSGELYISSPKMIHLGLSHQESPSSGMRILSLIVLD